MKETNNTAYPPTRGTTPPQKLEQLQSDGYTTWLLLCTDFSGYKIRHQLTAPQSVHCTQQPKPCNISLYYTCFVAPQYAPHQDDVQAKTISHQSIEPTSGTLPQTENATCFYHNLISIFFHNFKIPASAILPWPRVSSLGTASTALQTLATVPPAGTSLPRGSPAIYAIPPTNYRISKCS